MQVAVQSTRPGVGFGVQTGFIEDVPLIQAKGLLCCKTMMQVGQSFAVVPKLQPAGNGVGEPQSLPLRLWALAEVGAIKVVISGNETANPPYLTIICRREVLSDDISTLSCNRFSACKRCKVSQINSSVNRP